MIKPKTGIRYLVSMMKMNSIHGRELLVQPWGAQGVPMKVLEIMRDLSSLIGALEHRQSQILLST